MYEMLNFAFNKSLNTYLWLRFGLVNTINTYLG